MALGSLLHPQKGYPGQRPRREQQQPGIAQFLTHSADVRYLMVGFLLYPNLCVPVNLSLVTLLTARSETNMVACYDLFLDLRINLRVHISVSGDENRPPHLYAKSNCQLKEEEDMGGSHRRADASRAGNV